MANWILENYLYNLKGSDMPDIKPLEEILHALQNPIASIGGTYNEFMGSMAKPSLAYGNQTPVSPPLSDHGSYQQPTQQPSAWQGFVNKFKPASYQSDQPQPIKELTPEEELKVTSQGGQLAILNKGFR
jgi:hypothetical protein